jgi:hypothetical protein
MEVIDAVLIAHPDDPAKSVTAMFGQMLGVFKLQSPDIQQYVDSKVVIRGKDIPLKPIRKRPTKRPGRVYRDPEDKEPRRDPDGIVITIYDAFDMRFRDIPNDTFDKCFHEIGTEVIKPTAPQTHRNHRGVYTTNRFIVVKKTDPDGNKIEFGTHIKINDLSFKIAYFGMRSHCRLCGTTHGKECPSKARFEILKELRKNELLARKRKIYSDSTLRQTNQLALTSDVSCMSGGGIGQIVNFIRVDDPQENIVINAGTNEIKSDTTEDFVYSVMTARDKLKGLAASANITMVLPDYPAETPVEKARKEFLEKSMAEIDEIETIKLREVEWDNQPYHRHPTEDGTRNIINQLDEKIGGLIVEGFTNEIVSPLKYKFVQPVYKVGCRGCNDLNYVPTLCNVCKDAAQHVDVSDFLHIVGKWEAEMYPQMEIEDPETKKRNKRGIQSDSDSDDVGKSSKKKIDKY